MSSFSYSKSPKPLIDPLTACAGKVGFENYERAAMVLKRKGPKVPPGRTAYRCVHCHLWHVGSDGGVEKKRAATFKESKAYE